MKKNWHKENRDSALKITQGKCEKCGVIKNDFQIHHNNYKNINKESVYSFTFEFLHERGIVGVLCRSCHGNEHLGDNIDYCKICGRIAGTDRSKSLGIPYIICRKCFKAKGGGNGNFDNHDEQLSLF